MLSLPQVLHEAQRHAVVEIAIEPGEPVTFHGEQGVLVLGDPLGEGEISESLTQVLAPEQQADLAVASVVEFHVPGFAEWNFVAETSADGVIIRGRVREGDTPQEYGAPLDLPPLEPFEYERNAEIPRSSSVLRPAGSGSTRWDVGAVADDESTGDAPATEAPPPQSESQSEPVPGSVIEEVDRVPTGSLEDPTLASTMAQVRRVPGGHADGTAEVAKAELTKDEGLIDFALVGRPASTTDLPSVEDAAKPGGSGEYDPEKTAPRVSQDGGAGPTLRGDNTLSMHVVALNPSTVVHLAGIGASERLLAHYDGPHALLDHESVDEITSKPIDEVPLGQAYVVRLEDPSRCLAWILRRLEEGSCVIVETRARSAAGARRSLLGDAPSIHMARWLDAHDHLWIYAEGASWMLEQS